ncbi:hypothetical protein [Aliikangiella sp. IMCC44359]
MSEEVSEYPKLIIMAADLGRRFSGVNRGLCKVDVSTRLVAIKKLVG